MICPTVKIGEAEYALDPSRVERRPTVPPGDFVSAHNVGLVRLFQPAGTRPCHALVATEGRSAHVWKLLGREHRDALLEIDSVTSVSPLFQHELLADPEDPDVEQALREIHDRVTTGAGDGEELEVDRARIQREVADLVRHKQQAVSSDWAQKNIANTKPDSRRTKLQMRRKSLARSLCMITSSTASTFGDALASDLGDEDALEEARDVGLEAAAVRDDPGPYRLINLSVSMNACRAAGLVRGDAGTTTSSTATRVLIELLTQAVGAEPTFLYSCRTKKRPCHEVTLMMVHVATMRRLSRIARQMGQDAFEDLIAGLSTTPEALERLGHELTRRGTQPCVTCGGRKRANEEVHGAFARLVCRCAHARTRESLEKHKPDAAGSPAGAR